MEFSFVSNRTRGSEKGTSKLNEADVRMIRLLRKAGMKRKALAEVYGVGGYTIRDIMEGRTWGWLDA